MAKIDKCSGFRKEDFKVLCVDYDDCKEWLLYKHYAHRIPSISYAFGLYRGGVLEGVCTFGVPASPSLVTGIFGDLYKDKILELNRLCVNEGLPQNALSYFVGKCLKMLPKPLCIVSYADSGQNHHGYIYQATNWIYTGLSSAHKEYIIEGQENKHSRHINDNGGKKVSIGELKDNLGDKIQDGERSRKYRYFQFLGDKRVKRDMMKHFKYPIIKEYPKGDNVRYDASYTPTYQGVLFI